MDGYSLGSLLGYVLMVLVGVYIISVVYRWNKHSNKKNASKKTEGKEGNIALKESKHGLRLIFSAILILIGSLIIIASAFGAIIQFTSYGNDDTEGVSNGISNDIWDAEERSTLTSNCVSNVTELNATKGYGYSKAQIQNYCACNTDTIAQQYIKPSAFYNLSDPNKIYDEISMKCAEKHLSS